MFSHKAVDPEWHQIFLRGIGCNWLVCIAVWVRGSGINSLCVMSLIILEFGSASRRCQGDYLEGIALISSCHRMFRTVQTFQIFAIWIPIWVRRYFIYLFPTAIDILS